MRNPKLVTDLKLDIDSKIEAYDQCLNDRQSRYVKLKETKYVPSTEGSFFIRILSICRFGIYFKAGKMRVSSFVFLNYL